MPIIKSAKKRVKVAAKATARNVRTKRQMREALKELDKAFTAKKTDKMTEAYQSAISAIDMAANKAVIHKNKAARQKSRLAKMAKSAGMKPQAAKKAKSAPKAKTPSRKPTTKSKPTKA